MNKIAFERVQSQSGTRGKSWKNYLYEIEVFYSTYNYWLRKTHAYLIKYFDI